MTAIETEHRAAVREERPHPCVVPPWSTKPQRDHAVVRALLRVLGVPCADTEMIAPVAAPIDVRVRQAQFHLRALCDHPQGCVLHAHDTRVHQARMRADRADLRHPAVGIDLTVSVAHHCRRAGATRRVVWRSVCRTGCRGRCRWAPVRACSLRAGTRDPCFGPARLAIGVGVGSALRHGALCGQWSAGLSSHGGMETVTAMGQQRDPV